LRQGNFLEQKPTRFRLEAVGRATTPIARKGMVLLNRVSRIRLVRGNLPRITPIVERVRLALTKKHLVLARAFCASLACTTACLRLHLARLSAHLIRTREGVPSLLQIVSATLGIPAALILMPHYSWLSRST